jgi:hypothetical protein
VQFVVVKEEDDLFNALIQRQLQTLIKENGDLFNALILINRTMICLMLSFSDNYKHINPARSVTGSEYHVLTLKAHRGVQDWRCTPHLQLLALLHCRALSECVL